MPRSVRAGYADTVLPLSALFDRSDLPGGSDDVRPAMIWFSKLEADPKIEKRFFDSMEVAIASRWFHCVRIYIDDIESKKERERLLDLGPSVVFLDANGREVTRVVGAHASSPLIYSAMQKASAPDFKKPLTSLVEIYGAFLKRFDKVQGKVADLEFEIQDGQAHLMKHDCAPGRKRLKEDEEAMKPLVVERDKLLDEEKGLLKVELKTAKPEAAKAGG